MNLVLIHGRDQQGRNVDALKHQWLGALKLGLNKSGVQLPAKTKVFFPYFGDVLDELVKQLRTPLVQDVIARGIAQDSNEAVFRGELMSELAKNKELTDADILSNYTGVKRRGVLNWEWVQAILKTLDKTPLGQSALDAFTRDVYIYLTVKAVRQQIDKIVDDIIPNEPCVVVGHSLGSVIAYNVLRNTLRPIQRSSLITLGSPLGLKAIQNHLDSPLKMPSVISSWFNAFDKRDVVALQPLDADNFYIDPTIANKSDVDNHTNNRHGITGYLDDPVVSKIILDALNI
jgi:Lipase (class 3)